MTHFLKYIAARLFFGTIAAVLSLWGVLIWFHEVLYAGEPVDDLWLILGSYPLVLLVVSGLMSLWGGWRFRRILSRELDRISQDYHPEKLVKAYRRLMRYLESCYFFNTTREKLARVVALRFGGILLGMRIDDEEALAIYEKILDSEPENEKFYNFLIRAYSRKGRLSERSFNFLRRRYHEMPDDKLVAVLAREYTLRRMLTFESERVFQRCIKVYPQYRAKVLKFVIPRLLSFKRTDDNATLFYLAAAEAGWGAEVLGMLQLIEKRYREKSRDDELSRRVAQALSKLSAPREKSAQVQTSPPETGDPARSELSRSEDTFTFVGLDYDEGEKPGEMELEIETRAQMNLESRFHSMVQRLIAGTGPTVGWVQKWARPVLLVILLAVLVYLAAPLIRRMQRAFTPERKANSAQAVENIAAEHTAVSQPRYAIQVGAFSDSSTAAGLCERLKHNGVESYLVKGQARGKPVFKVRIGKFSSDSAAANQARSLLSSRLIEEWQVVPYLQGQK